MGNGLGKVRGCFSGDELRPRRSRVSGLISEQLDEGLGHSFCYIRPDPLMISSSKIQSFETVTFKSISGASVSANNATPLSTSLIDLYSVNGGLDRSTAFESSMSFSFIPLQTVPRSGVTTSGSSAFTYNGNFGSGPIDRGFMSGPIERGFMSGPIDEVFSSGYHEKGPERLQRSFSNGELRDINYTKKKSLVRGIRKTLGKVINRGRKNPILRPIETKNFEWTCENPTLNSSNFGAFEIDDEDFSTESQNVQWAQGKAGEDRIHIVISEKNEWVFVGIYDGFNGPDATDYLVSNLYNAVQKELKGLLWEEQLETSIPTFRNFEDCQIGSITPGVNSEYNSTDSTKQWEQNKTLFNWESNKGLNLGRKIEKRLRQLSLARSVNHSDVLQALSRALEKTEEKYLDIADKMVMENPELSLMGSCLLVMLMKGEDVYLMNVGDSRAVLSQSKEDTLGFNLVHNVTATQLTSDHNTSVKEEVQRIKDEHPDDDASIVNDRIKGTLKVTRAFGAGYLKQPKWNNAILEMFRIDYVGTSPYVTCSPSLHHHRLSPRDRFLILSSDGLYQYYTNEEAVADVEQFVALCPEGDPAQHLIEGVLFRAAKKAGMDFHELLDIPQGDRRRYHDDISVIVLSLEGRIWRSRV